MEDKLNQAEDHDFQIVCEAIEKNGLLYACEKLGMVVWKLATGTGVIKERLADAYIELAILQESDFPEELRSQYNQIRKDLTSGRMYYEQRVENGQMKKIPVGKLYSTLRYMRKDKAQEIARQICELESKINCYRRDRYS